MKIAIVGSRDFNDYQLLKETIFSYISKNNIEMIVSGGASGADSLAETLAKKEQLPILIFYAKWDKYGKKAGFIRNKDIIKNSDIVFAFWDGNSKGTANSIKLAKDYKKELIIKRF